MELLFTRNGTLTLVQIFQFLLMSRVVYITVRSEFFAICSSINSSLHNLLTSLVSFDTWCMVFVSSRLIMWRSRTKIRFMSVISRFTLSFTISDNAVRLSRTQFSSTFYNSSFCCCVLPSSKSGRIGKLSQKLILSGLRFFDISILLFPIRRYSRSLVLTGFHFTGTCSVISGVGFLENN